MEENITSIFLKTIKILKELLETTNQLFPISKEEEDNLNKNKNFDPNNTEFEVWRAVKNTNNTNNSNNTNNNNEHLVLTEYLEKIDNSKNEYNSENLLKNKKVINHQKNLELLILKDDYFDRDNQEDNENNNNLDEDYSDNSDKEIEKIQNERENENDDDDDEDITQSGNKSRSKKGINNKVVEAIENNKSEYPDFYAECKYYGENKERYQVKISIDSSFNIVLSTKFKNKL